MKNTDILIIGNGISGLSLAYQLKKADKSSSLLVVGPKSRPGSATLAAGAMINVLAEIPYGCFENDALTDRFQLAINAPPLWSTFTEEMQEFEPTFEGPRGNTVLFINSKSTSVEIKTFKYIKAWMEKSGYGGAEIDPDKCPFLRPSPSYQTISAIELPDQRVCPVTTLQALELAIETLGVESIDQSATELNISKPLIGKKKKSVTLSDGTKVAAEHIVLANGSFAQALMDQNTELKAETPRLLFGGGGAVNVFIPDWVKELGGIGRTLLNCDSVIRTPDRGGSCGIHAVPHHDGRWYIGASSGIWLEESSRPKLAGTHFLLHSSFLEINREFFFGDVELVGNGYRPTTIDCFPLLGESHIDGIWFSNGMKRDGFTCSPFISTELAKAMLGQTHALPERFRPSRSLISYKDKESAIVATEDFYRGMDMHHGGAPDAPFLFDAYQTARFQGIRKVYETRNIENFGIHPEVLHLYDNDNFYEVVKHAREIA